METRPLKIACKKCQSLILQTTSLRNGGRCIPCSRATWHDPLRNIPLFVCAFLIWPFVILSRAGLALANIVLRVVPGTRSNFRAKLGRGWRPAWPMIQRLWSKAKSVDHGSIGPNAKLTIESIVLMQVIEDGRTSSSTIQLAITPTKPTLSAYCILALSYRREFFLLSNLPSEVVQSDGEFEYRAGCVSLHETVGNFLARQRALINETESE
jgi:hypothetical protein